MSEVEHGHRPNADLTDFFDAELGLLCIRDTDGFFRRVNPAFQTVLGYAEDELLQQPIRAFMHPDDVARTEMLLGSLAPGSSAPTFEDRWRCADGSWKTLAWSASRSEDGEYVYAIARDV